MDWDDEVQFMRTCQANLATLRHFIGMTHTEPGRQRNHEWLEMANRLEENYEFIPYPRIEELVNTFRDGANWINDPNYNPDPQRHEHITELLQDLRQWTSMEYSRRLDL
jgi:hypothetical protein